VPAIKQRQLIITSTATADLDDIYDYIAADSPETAERFVTSLLADLHRIAYIGVTGVARDSIRPGLRMHPFGKYCAYFYIDDTHLKVSRVLHSRQDINSIVFEPANGNS
jgi:toxin ParE1/3/4